MHWESYWHLLFGCWIAAITRNARGRAAWYQVDSRHNHNDESAPPPPDEKEHKSTTARANPDLAPKQAIGSTSLTRPTSTGQTAWQGAIGHKRQHTAPLACICRKTSPSVTRRDKILRESWGSGGPHVAARAECRRGRWKWRSESFFFGCFSNVQLLPKKKSFASFRASV